MFGLIEAVERPRRDRCGEQTGMKLLSIRRGSRKMNHPLRHDHQELLHSLVSGKLPRNLSWSSVIDLIGNIGVVQPHGNDEFIFAVGSQRCFFKRPGGHNLAVEEISRLRRFLKEVDALGTPANASKLGRTVAIVDHHVAHIYHELGDGGSEGEVNVKPYDPFGFHHHLIHRKEAHYIGERVPEEDSMLRRDRHGPCAGRSDRPGRK